MNRERGRPRSFDVNVALDRALQVFWRHGFQGASLSDLTAAMGLSKPSLYAAFGDKETLYLKALERYADLQIEAQLVVFNTEADVRTALEKFLRAMAAALSDPKLPGGCFVVTGIADCGMRSTPPAIESALSKAVQASEARLRDHFLRAQRDTRIDPNLSAKDLAAFYTSVLAGLGVLAKAGAKQGKLNGIIDTAMAAWPVSKTKVAKQKRITARAR